MESKKPKRAFKGIWIPKHLWLAEDLTLQEKVFLAEIDSLNRGAGCYASNSYFAKFFGLSKKRVSFIINSLCQKERVKSEIDTKAGNRRKLWVCPQKQGDPIPENGDTPIPENGEQDNTDNKGENKEDNNNDFSLRKLSKAEAQDRAHYLLIRFGVKPKVAHSIVYEQHIPPRSIEETIQNGLTKEKYEKGFVMQAGYIVATLNGARKEGKVVGPTKKSRVFKKHLDQQSKAKNRPPLTQKEFAEKKEKQIASLQATSQESGSTIK